MKIMDKLARFLGIRPEASGRLQSSVPDPNDSQNTNDSNPGNPAGESLPHAGTATGDASLHNAYHTDKPAPTGLLQSEMDPDVPGIGDRRAPNVVPVEPPHIALQPLSQADAQLLPAKPDALPENLDAAAALQDDEEVNAEFCQKETPAFRNYGISDGFDDLITFESEEEPEDFFTASPGKYTSGNFTVFAVNSEVASDDAGSDWKIDLSPARIVGEGISSEATTSPDQDGEHDFLKVRNRGPRTAKPAVVQRSTRMSIEPKACQDWAEAILLKGWFTPTDMEMLIDLSEGNGDPEELQVNLQRTLEAAGLELLDQESEYGAELWDVRSDISPDDLAEAVEAVFTRSTRLPGTRRFTMDKSNEARLLEQMVLAKQELQIGILVCKAAVEAILQSADQIRHGIADPGPLPLKIILSVRPAHAETAEFFAAADSLSLWYADGGAMDGKRRREALRALDALDLPIPFYRQIVQSLTTGSSSEAAARIGRLIETFEDAAKHLVMEHLSYARRYAFRNVEDGEDPEDVFQVAFTGLHRSIRRFDPDRGVRFVVYCTYWMRQALNRWRADEGAAIRIPMHRHEKLIRLDEAVDILSVRSNGNVSDDELAYDTGLDIGEVQLLRGVPRQAHYPEVADEWEDLLPEEEVVDVFGRKETKRIIDDALAELQGRQADVLRMRFGIERDAEMTLEEIGQVYGVTRERIRQIEAKALLYLSHPGRLRRLQASLGL
jgi:RNA polymerase primary sigma factor